MGPLGYELVTSVKIRYILQNLSTIWSKELNGLHPLISLLHFGLQFQWWSYLCGVNYNIVWICFHIHDGFISFFVIFIIILSPILKRQGKKWGVPKKNWLIELLLADIWRCWLFEICKSRDEQSWSTFEGLLSNYRSAFIVAGYGYLIIMQVCFSSLHRLYYLLSILLRIHTVLCYQREHQWNSSVF